MVKDKKGMGPNNVLEIVITICYFLAFIVLSATAAANRGQLDFRNNLLSKYLYPLFWMVILGAIFAETVWSIIQNTEDQSELDNFAKLVFSISVFFVVGFMILYNGAVISYLGNDKYGTMKMFFSAYLITFATLVNIIMSVGYLVG